jgi:hypothetical protein
MLPQTFSSLECREQHVLAAFKLPMMRDCRGTGAILVVTSPAHYGLWCRINLIGSANAR